MSQNRVQVIKGKIDIFNKIRMKSLYDKYTKNKVN